MSETTEKHPALLILEDLVRIQSVNPHYREGAQGEKAVSDYIEQCFQGKGLKVTRQCVLPNRDNILVELRIGNPDSALLFEAHMDTVSLGSMENPLTPVYKEGRMYARGACDTKGSLAGMIWAMEQCAKHPEQLSSDIIFCATVDEEHEYRGLRSFMELNMPIAGAVVGEPTELGIVIAHKGCARFTVTTHGKAAHSSMPEKGDSAVYQMLDVLQFIKERIEVDLAAARHPLCGTPSIVVGTIRGGTQINIVPERCEIEVDLRIIPGELPDEALTDFQRKLQVYIKEKGLSVNFSIQELLLDWALDTPKDASIVSYAAQAAKVLGLSHEVVGVPYGSDASKLSLRGIPSIVYGPGSIAQAHSKEEWVPVSDVEQAAQFYYQIAKMFGK
jgi:acetylornithine deacetylase/succinyl-diaminopimelate desuccinylase family protein